MTDQPELSLVIISDCLVLTALERAFTRVASHRDRRVTPAISRHRGYERYSIPYEQIEGALKDAWVLCPVLAVRHHLDVQVLAWQELLHTYCTALISMGQPHSVGQLRQHLAELEPPAPFDDDDDFDDLPLAWDSAAQ